MALQFAHAKSRWKIFVDFLGRHRNLVTVLSAFTVFASFLIKEGWDDHLKEVVGSVREAEAQMEHYDEQMQMDDKLLDIRVDLHAMRRKLVLQDPQFDVSREKLGRVIFATAHPSLQIGADEVLLQALLPILPKAKLYTQEMEQIEKKSSALWRRYNDWKRSINAEKLDVDSSDFHSFEGNDKWETVSAQADEVVHKALNEAKEIREWNQRYHRVCVRLTYFFFVIGWSVGLVSNMAGIRPGAKPE